MRITNIRRELTDRNREVVSRLAPIQEPPRLKKSRSPGKAKTTINFQQEVNNLTAPWVGYFIPYRGQYCEAAGLTENGMEIYKVDDMVPCVFVSGGAFTNVQLTWERLGIANPPYISAFLPLENYFSLNDPNTPEPLRFPRYVKPAGVIKFLGVISFKEYWAGPEGIIVVQGPTHTAAFPRGINFGPTHLLTNARIRAKLLNVPGFERVCNICGGFECQIENQFHDAAERYEDAPPL